MEKIVLHRIQWYLETYNRLDARQTGFREAMGTQDSLKLLYEEVMADKDAIDPRLIVALDIKKAFDEVPHWAVIQGAKDCGMRGKTLRFIRSFLTDRMFQVKIGKTRGPEMSNSKGDPQGAVISPTLFNMVMAGLPARLRRVTGLGFTIYADDITLWTKGGAMANQEQTMQQGIDEVLEYLQNVGMQASPEKTQFMVVARPRDHRKGVADQVDLHIQGQKIKREKQIKILGVTFEETARSTKWLPALEKSWGQTLKLVRKTTSKSWGADEDTIRILTNALLTAKALYSCNWLNLTKTQWKRLERLNHRTMRLVTGLPKYTALEDLKKNAGMNQIQDRAEVQSIAHFQRLERTNHGRKLLEIMGYEAEGRLPLEDPAPPWQDTNIVDHRPLPRAHNQGRRARAATQHAKWCDEHAHEEEIRYTDASKTDITTVTAWIDPKTGRESTTRLPENSSVREAELRAILEATIDILKNTEGPRRARIFTDSQEALRACRDSKPKSRTAKRIKAIARELKAKGIVLTLEWIPGHAQIPGNEWAHRVAAEAASSNSSATGSTTREDNEETEDPVEQAALARQARKAYLRGLVPTEEDPLPNGYRRWEATRLRRIRTGTALTPAKLAAFGLLEEEDPICKGLQRK